MDKIKEELEWISYLLKKMETELLTKEEYQYLQYLLIRREASYSNKYPTCKTTITGDKLMFLSDTHHGNARTENKRLISIAYNKALQQNIKTFEEEKPLNEEEMKSILEIADNMLQGNILPCTACRYCTAHCPKGIDIPKILALYNEHTFTGGGFIAPMAISALPDDKKPSACIGCKSCEAVCPQQLKIAEAMSNFTNLLNK